MVVYEKCVNKMTDDVVVEMSARESNKKFLIVNNHVREVPIQYVANPNEDITQQTVSKNVVKSIKRKPGKKCNKKPIDTTYEDTEISNSDLEELRTVYKKCKAVINKIETKYGHLLEMDGEGSSSMPQKRKLNEEIEECHCEINKKIVFDEDGQEITVDTSTENHICQKKIKDTPKHKNIDIQYTDNETPLPDNLEELLKLLKDPDMENTFRNRVIYKIKSLKDEILDEIRFNKRSLIEQLKVNPDEVLAFEGTNLSSIPGYI